MCRDQHHHCSFLKGIATICKADSFPFCIGYLQTIEGTFKMLLTKSEEVPKIHDCCTPKAKDSNNDFASSAPVFWDVLLKSGSKSIVIKQLQERDPGNDDLRLSTEWSDTIISRHDDESFASFQTQKIFVGTDAFKVVERLFTTFKQENQDSVTVWIGDFNCELAAS